jgi:hypothetical protein
MSYRNQPTQEECDSHQKDLIEKAPWKQFIHCWGDCCFRKMCWSMKKERGMEVDDINDTFCPMMKIMEREFDSHLREKSLE